MMMMEMLTADTQHDGKDLLQVFCAWNVLNQKK